MPFDMRRRDFLHLAGSGALGGAHLLASSRAFAADLIPVGVIIPGSTSDRGWMQSGYTGMLKVEKDLADKIKITSITDVSMADMEQALTSLAMSNSLVVGAAANAKRPGTRSRSAFRM